MTPARKWQVRKVGEIWLVIDRDGNVVGFCQSHREAIINVDAMTRLERVALDWTRRARAALDELAEAWRNITRAIRDFARPVLERLAEACRHTRNRRRERDERRRPPRRLTHNVNHTNTRPARPTTVHRRITP